jgi:hypothetical protein
MEIAVVTSQGTMNDGSAIRVNAGRTLKEAKGRQRLEIGWILTEIRIVGREGHGTSSSAYQHLRISMFHEPGGWLPC